MYTGMSKVTTVMRASTRVWWHQSKLQCEQLACLANGRALTRLLHASSVPGLLHMFLGGRMLDMGRFVNTHPAA
jgi:hypothetical protein